MAPATERETIAKEVQTAVRHTAVYGVGSVLVKSIGFLMLPFYTYYLNPSDYGILEILDLSMSLLGMLLNMGITAALLRAYTAGKTSEEQRNSVSTAFHFVVATGAVTFLLMLGLVRPVSALVLGPHVPSTYLLLSLSAFILGYIVNVPRAYIRALEASSAFVMVDTISLVLMLGLNIYFIAFLKIGLSGILWSSLIVVALQIIVLCSWMLRRVGLGFSRTLLKQMVVFGWPLIFSSLAMFTLNFSDRFFLQHLRSMDEVGIYAVGYKFGFMMNYLLVQSFHAMWQSRMYVIHAHSDHKKIFGQIFVLYSLVLSFAGLALAVLSPEIVRVMVGPKFAASKEVIPVVSAAYIFYGVGYYAQSGMYLANRTKLVGMISAAAGVLNLGLNFFLIRQYGMMGAAWATLLSFLAIACASYWLSQRVLPLPLGAMRVSAAIALAIGFYFVSRLTAPLSFGGALLVKVLILGAFPVLVWRSPILERSERETLALGGEQIAARFSRALGLTPRTTEAGE